MRVEVHCYIDNNKLWVEAAVGTDEDYDYDLSALDLVELGDAIEKAREVRDALEV